ncbi:MAG: arsenical pump membrane protein-domain-containing protein [Piptocephalis tieghemiana]|nr:MAG: arsenical pump membrane protein-domain-containing protein [Piptocephalis tieghemiana]
MTPLDFRSWITLILFLFAAAFVNAPQAFCIPWTKGKYRFILNLVTAPVLAVILGLATTAISPAELWRGIAGSDGIEPYSILILLLSLSYVCISLDLTGGLAMTSLWFTTLAGRRGRLFYTVIFFTSLFYATITNNDVAILTLTPVTIYFAKAMRLPPYAMLLGEFIASNTASMILFTGNLTNIVVAQAYGLNFAQYAAWMILPALGSAVCSWMVLMIQYRKDIPKAVDPPVVRPRSALKEPWFALTGLFLVAGTIIALAVSSFYHISVWMVSLPFAVVGLIIDLIRDTRIWQRRRRGEVVEVKRGGEMVIDEREEEEEEEKEELSPQGMDSQPSLSTLTTCSQGSSPKEEERGVEEAELSSSSSPPPPPDPPREPNIFTRFLLRIWGMISPKIPITSQVLVQLPYAVFPFSFGMFILVEGLSAHGWTVRLAKVLVYCCPNPTVAAFTVGFISSLACIPFNNVPMTILFARALLSEQFTANTTESTHKASLFALAIGSNLGANLTIFASLAGVMWATLSQAKGVQFTGWRFFQACLWSFPLSVGAACAILAAEVAVMEKQGG